MLRNHPILETSMDLYYVPGTVARHCIPGDADVNRTLLVRRLPSRDGNQGGSYLLWMTWTSEGHGPNTTRRFKEGLLEEVMLNLICKRTKRLSHILIPGKGIPGSSNNIAKGLGM